MSRTKQAPKATAFPFAPRTSPNNFLEVTVTDGFVCIWDGEEEILSLNREAAFRLSEALGYATDLLDANTRMGAYGGLKSAIEGSLEVIK